MPLSIKDIQLPGPTTRIVVFEDIVFKLKYRLSDNSLNDLVTNPNVQADLKKITALVLDSLLSSQTLVPLKTDYMVIYPALKAWSLVTTNQLLFYHNGLNLRAHADIVYLLVHLFAHPPPSTPPTQIVNQVCLGKRSHPDDQKLPGNTGVLRSEYIIRKKLRFETEPALGDTPQVPKSAALPTEHAQLRAAPSSETISGVAMTMKSKLEKLSQPTNPPTSEPLETAVEGSIFSGIVRSVKSFFGWT